MTVADNVTLDNLIMVKNDLSGADIKAVSAETGLMALWDCRMKVANENLDSLKRMFFIKKQEGTAELLYL